MGVQLGVREFDIITSNPDYITEYKYLPRSVFDDLENFIRKYAAEGNSADALEFLRLGYKRGVGDTISINNYVGLIQIGKGNQIEVLPKIDFKTKDDEVAATKRIFIKMLRSMKDFPVKKFNMADLQTDRMNLYEIFINMYIKEAAEITKKGLKSDYVRQENNLGFFKGKLLVNQHIKVNLAHREKFYVSYDEFLQDCSENRLIKSTLLKLESISEDNKNLRELKRILTYFEPVNRSTNFENDFANVTINRGNKNYEDILRWSKVFLQNKSFTTFSGDSNSRALLFPMEKVFEAYVIRELKKLLPSCWDLSAQDKTYYLFDNPRQFALRPDIAITRDDGHQIILDTKWKRLFDNPNKNYGISGQDMYQMYAYATKYDAKDIFLLYPVTDEMRGRDDVSFQSYKEGTLIANIRVFFIDVVDIENNLDKLVNEIAIIR